MAIFKDEVKAARRVLLDGSRVVIGTVPVSEQRIRIIQIRTKQGKYEGKWLFDGKWYPVYKLEVQ